ncbi:hypothetical protein [Sporisorium scitamineum]|uniref:SET domain-containing protein n=1 Tax=Sporisorium scitamineum TaxID=49012 RepID=A0A0F7S8T7_9BASI|nr:hypothetical protein [Sporisorium scitamineum]
MIKPPVMGVFARDPPPTTGKGGASLTSSSSSSSHPQLVSTDLPSSHQGSSVPTTNPADLTASDPLQPDDEAAQDDDDQGTVDEEAGVIRCICGCDDDDGFTIQCDRCLVWQHCACFGMSQASVPDEYLCEQCEPRPVDVAFAQAHQQKRKNNEARKALMDRNLKRQAQALASNNTYNSQPYLGQDAVASPTSSTHPASSAMILDESSFAGHQNASLVPPSAAAARSRKPSQALDLSNTQFVVPELPASAGASHKGAKQRNKGHKGSRRGYDTPSSVSTPVRGVFTPGSSHERADDPFDLADQLEAWHVEFTPIAKNMVADPSILQNLAVAMLDWEDGSPLKAAPGPSGRVTVPTAPRISKLSHVDLHPTWSSVSSPSSSSPRALLSPGLEPEVTGISAVGQECVPVELSGPSLADLACNTYVRHISESASAGVFSNLLYVSNSADEPQRGWCASRAFSRPVMHGLFADGSIPAGAFISEFRGELYSADAYRNNPINQYAALGATKPHVHLLPPPLNLAIDARRYGNEARFARFSCHPNAVLRPILFYPNGQPLSARSRTSSRAQSPSPAAVLSARHNRYADTPPAESRSEEPQLLFGLFALVDIPRTHEITVGWEWDDAHIVHFLPELVQNPYLEPRHGDVDADQHTANMVALAEKGEFPYADTEFSVKMSTVAAALLGCVLCACIGSAAPPGGGGGASANNGRKQDCAVAQMLRVGNGMSLLNVTMPGKTNRRAKLPDFSPLVGIRRHWRPFSLPPTPDTSAKDAASPADPALLAALAAEGEAQAIRLLDDVELEGEAGCGGNEAVAKRNIGRRGGRTTKQQHCIDAVDSGSDVGHAASDSDVDDDSRSIASSLTDPLSGLSDNETLSEDEDQDLMDAMRAASGLQPRRRSAKGGEANIVDAELSGLFLLPPKKRSMRTRIKANMAPSDDGEATDREDPHEEVENVATVKAVKKVKPVSKRKTKLDVGRTGIGFSSDEEQEHDSYSAATPAKKRRKSGNIADPSSPLSSVPSPNSELSGLSPPPPVPRLSAKHRLENERRLSDVELSKKKRAAKRGRNGNAKANEPRSKELASKRRKREEARIHRNAILDLGDTESSEERDADDEDDGNDDSDRNKHVRDQEADVTMADADSRASTPRASRTDAKEAHLGETSLPGKTIKKERLSTPTAADDRKSTHKDTPTKTKKVRRILSDSEASSDEADVDQAASTPTATEKQAAVEPSEAAVDTKTADATPKAEEDKEVADPATAGQTSTPATAPEPTPAPAPVPEVKKEEPRIKLSLAEYKRRLAERRVSEQQGANASTAPLTPSLATPTSEFTPSPSPALERSDPLPSFPLRASEPTLTTTATETISTPTSLVPPTPTTGIPEAATETGKASSSAVPRGVSRGVLFTSISAPTAIRSVEIPKSPSPEPAASLSAQQQQSGSVSEAAAASNEPGTAGSDDLSTTVAAQAGAASSASGTQPMSSPASSLSALAAAGSSADTPALLMRLETRRARAPSMSHQPGGSGGKDAQQVGPADSGSADADGFAKPITIGTSQANASSSTIAWGTAASASTPLRSPSLGPTRVQPGGRLPPSPSGSSTFNPPKAPRAFMSPPGTALPPPSTMPTSSIVHGVSTSATVSMPASTTSPAVASTPARVGIAGVAAGVGNTPSTASSVGSSASSRYPPHGLTSPTPATTALPAGGSSSAGYAPRNYAGVPKGPASMRDSDPRADAWAEAREVREARDARGGDYAGPLPRHHDAVREGGRDMGWGERSREPSGMAERETLRGGWGRERRDVAHSRAGYGRDERYFGRDDRDAASTMMGSSGGSSVGSDLGGSGGAGSSTSGPGLADRRDSYPHSHSHSHSHAPPHYSAYRRPSATDYDDAVRGPAVSPYDRASDPYNRGIGIRGRSLGLGGGGANATHASSSGAPGGVQGTPAAAGGGGGGLRDTARGGDYRDYDDLGGGPPSGHPPHARGGFRNSGGPGGGGWGGRSRPRGSGSVTV